MALYNHMRSPGSHLFEVVNETTSFLSIEHFISTLISLCTREKTIKSVQKVLYFSFRQFVHWCFVIWSRKARNKQLVQRSYTITVIRFVEIRLWKSHKMQGAYLLQLHKQKPLVSACSNLWYFVLRLVFFIHLIGSHFVMNAVKK